MIFEQGPRPEDSYTLISNRLAREPGLSLQAKGIYIFMRSHRSGWSMNVRSVADALGVSKGTVSKYINELIEFGYIQREQAQGDDGQFGDVRYLILSEPCTNSPDTVNQDSTRPKLPDTVLPDTVNQDTKEDYSFKKTKAEEDEKNTMRDSSSGSRFDEWWEHYPKKVAKGQARTAFKTALKKISFDDLVQATDVLARNSVNVEKRFIPNPATWLNGERWADEDIQSASAGGASKPDIRKMLDEIVAQEDEVDESAPF